MARTMLEDTARDLRHGIRVLRRASGFPTGALLTLGRQLGGRADVLGMMLSTNDGARATYAQLEKKSPSAMPGAR